MSAGGRLLTKVLESPSHFLMCRRAGITAHIFNNPIEKEVWQFIEEYFDKHKVVPSVQDVKTRVPLFVPQHAENRTLSELIEQIKLARIELDVVLAINEAQELMRQNKHEEALAILQRGISSATRNISATSDSSLTSAADSILSRYKYMKEGGFYHGIPWPWKPLQEATGGIEDGTYSVLYGRPKSTKTWRLLQIASEARKFGNKVLFVSNELPRDLVLLRIAALECQLPYDKYRKGELSEEEEQRLIQYVQSLKESQEDGDIIVTTLTDGASPRTVSALKAKLDQYQPDLLLIDSVYKLTDELSGLNDATPTVMRNISANLQLLAQRENIPIVITAQANRKGEKVKVDSLEDVAHTDSLAMDADLLIRIVNVRQISRTLFLIKAAREIELDGFATMNRCADNLGPYVGPGGVEDWDLPGAVSGQEDDEDAQRPTPRNRFIG